MMRMVLVAGVLLGACADLGVGPGAGDAPDAGPSVLEVRCREVGVAYCEAQYGCRPGHPPESCEKRWAVNVCGAAPAAVGTAPEDLTEEQAQTCAAKWLELGQDCKSWWVAGWWDWTAPTCAELAAAS